MSACVREPSRSLPDEARNRRGSEYQFVPGHPGSSPSGRWHRTGCGVAHRPAYRAAAAALRRADPSGQRWLAAWGSWEILRVFHARPDGRVRLARDPTAGSPSEAALAEAVGADRKTWRAHRDLLTAAGLLARHEDGGWAISGMDRLEGRRPDGSLRASHLHSHRAQMAVAVRALRAADPTGRRWRAAFGAWSLLRHLRAAWATGEGTVGLAEIRRWLGVDRKTWARRVELLEQAGLLEVEEPAGSWWIPRWGELEGLAADGDQEEPPKAPARPEVEEPAAEACLAPLPGTASPPPADDGLEVHRGAQPLGELLAGWQQTARGESPPPVGRVSRRDGESFPPQELEERAHEKPSEKPWITSPSPCAEDPPSAPTRTKARQENDSRRKLLAEVASHLPQAAAEQLYDPSDAGCRVVLVRQLGQLLAVVGDQREVIATLVRPLPAPPWHSVAGLLLSRARQALAETRQVEQVQEDRQARRLAAARGWGRSALTAQVSLDGLAGIHDALGVLATAEERAEALRACAEELHHQDAELAAELRRLGTELALPGETA